MSEKVIEKRRSSTGGVRRSVEIEKEMPLMADAEDVDSEPDETLGWFSLEDRARWPLMSATTGRLLITPIQVEEKTEMIPFFITGHKVLGDGSLSLRVTSLGTKDPKVSRKVTNMNKLCQSFMCAWTALAGWQEISSATLLLWS